MFWSKKKKPLSENTFAYVHDALTNHKKAIELSSNDLGILKREMIQLAQNVNNSLMQMNGQINQCLAQVQHADQQIQKNLEIFRECSLRAQLVQTVGMTVSDPAKRMKLIAEMTEFVLKGQIQGAEGSDQSAGGNVMPLHPVGRR